jgi:hypothetical protein
MFDVLDHLAGARLVPLKGKFKQNCIKCEIGTIAATCALVPIMFGSRRMPRYFFHVHDGMVIIDHEGLELSDADEARTQALISAGDMIRDKGVKLWSGQTWTMQVKDAVGRTICGLSFCSARGEP